MGEVAALNRREEHFAQADQTAAVLADATSTAPAAAQPADAVPVAAQPADTASDAKQPAESFDERVARLERAVSRHPLHKEINLEILRFCQGQRVLQEVEEHVLSMPQAAQATLSAYRLIANLERAGGLERFSLDADGQILTSAQLEGLTEDQVDDLVSDYAFQTTDEGETVVADASPKNRIDHLLDEDPQLMDTYAGLLSFFEEGGRSYDSVCELMRGSDALLKTMTDGSTQRMQPSVFVDRLERAGAIEWDGGWTLTEGGRAALDRLLG